MSSDAPTVEVRPKRFRKLPIAWTVAWGVMAVLFCAMWIRSYWQWEELYYVYPQNRVVCAAVRSGAVTVAHSYADKYFVTTKRAGWRFHHGMNSQPFAFRNVFRVFRRPDSYSLVVPLWILAVASAATTAIPWLPLRFSLRTLLIVTTLLAVGLSLVAYSRRSPRSPAASPAPPAPANPFKKHVPTIGNPYQYPTPPNEVDIPPIG